MAKLKRFWSDEFKTTIKEGDIEGDFAVLKHTVLGEVSVVKEAENEEDGFTLNFKISDAAVDSEGDTISTKGWDLKRYKKNPIVLFAHDGDQPPVGKASNLEVRASKGDQDALFSNVTFTSRDLFPFGNMIGRMVKAGFLRAASVGFIPKQGEFAEERAEDFWMPFDFLKQELLEWSVVPVPANPNALQGAKSMGIDTRPLREWAEKTLDGEKSGLWVPRHRLEEIYHKTKEKTLTNIPNAVDVEESVEGAEPQTTEEEPHAEPAQKAPPVEPKAEANEAEAQPESKVEEEQSSKSTKGLNEEEAKEYFQALLKEALAQLAAEDLI